MKSINFKQKTATLRAFAEKNPVKALAILLFLTLMLIVAGNQLRAPDTSNMENSETAMPVELFYIGKPPSISLVAKAEKSGVIDIYSQTGGVVNNVYVLEGQEYSYGTNIIGIASNYTGGNIPYLQMQLAKKQYDNAKETLPDSKELIEQQKDLVNKQDKSADELRALAVKTEVETKDVVKLNEDILSSLNENLELLEQTNVGGANDSDILLTKQSIATYTAALNANKQALRNLELNSDSSGTNSSIATLNKETALKQLDLQNKALELNVELSRLQYQIAAINNSFFYPSLPFASVIQEVHVSQGDIVNPGTKIATIAGLEGTTTLKAYVPEEVAKNLKSGQEATISNSGNELDLVISYVSQEPTQGQLHYVLFSLADFEDSTLKNNETVVISLPVGVEDSSGAFVTVPIDAVHQTAFEDTVYVKEGNSAKSKQITLGSVIGEYVEVLEGLSSSDEVILNRNVLDGDLVSER